MVKHGFSIVNPVPKRKKHLTVTNTAAPGMESGTKIGT